MDKINKYAARFQEVRKKLDLTQQALADRLLLSRNFIAKIESGAAEPSARTLSSLEALLNESTRPSHRPRFGEQGAGVICSLHEEQSPYYAGAALPAAPTEQEVTDYFLVALGEARQIPGGVGYVSMILKMHLNPEQIKKLKG